MPPSTKRRPLNVSLPASVIEEARQPDINLSRACEQGIGVAIKAERERRWKQRHADAIADYNTWVEESGLPLTEYREF